MSQPPSYSRQFSFSNFQANNPSLSLPGSQVDLELNSAKATLDAINANLKLIQRDDGGVANASIGLTQLKAEVPVGFNAPVVWTTGTAYAAGSSTVFNGSGFYRCLIAHTSGTFATDLAAGDWQLIVNLAAVPLVAANQIAVTPSGNLTTDVQGSLQALDAAKAALSHTQLSSTISDSTAVGRALLTAPDVPTQNTLLGTTLLGFQSGDVKETAVLVLQSGWYYCDGSNKNRVTDAPLFNAITIQQSGTLNATAVITSLSDTTNGGSTPISIGMPVSGTNIPANTVVQSVDSATQVTLSAAATGSGVTALVFAPYGVGDGLTTFGLPNRAYLGVGRDNMSGSASNINQVSTTITTANASATATVASATGLFVGMFIQSAKITTGTKITAISGTSITMSAAATGVSTGVAARFSPIVDAQTPGQVGGALSQSTTLVATNLPPITSSANNSITVGNASLNLASTNGTVSNEPAPSTGGNTVPTSSTSWAALNAALFGANTITVTSTGTNSTPIIKSTMSSTIVMNYVIKR